MRKFYKLIFVVWATIGVALLIGMDMWLLSQIVPISTVTCGGIGHEIKVTYPRSLDTVCDDLKSLTGAPVVFATEDEDDGIRIEVSFVGGYDSEENVDTVIFQNITDPGVTCTFSAAVFLPVDKGGYRVDIEISKNLGEECSTMEHPKYYSDYNHGVALGVAYQHFTVEVLTVVG